jgi:hypothetical protein
MIIKDIEDAMEEAERFVHDAYELLAAAGKRGQTHSTSFFSPRENGIVKARSLLLRRALAKMRRSGR